MNDYRKQLEDSEWRRNAPWCYRCAKERGSGMRPHVRPYRETTVYECRHGMTVVRRVGG